MDVGTMIKEINRISKENERLSIIQKEYVKNAEDLKKIASNLLEIAKRIDPVISKSGRKKRSDKSEMIQPLLEKMNAGTQITTKLIETMYPNLVKFEIYGLFAKLKQMPGVKYVKDGHKSRLFK